MILSKKGVILCIGFMFVLAVLFPAASFAGDDVQELKQQLKDLNEKLKFLQEKIDQVEKKEAGKEKEIKEIDQRLNKAELHTATDKLSLGIELKTRADSIHYKDLLIAPGQITNGFFAAPPQGFNGATLKQIQQGMAGMAAAGMVPPPNKYDADNDMIDTSKFRLEMKSKINENLTFGGRLAAYKVFGDSTGVKFNQGSLGDVTFDGNTSSLPHGDTIRLERAYFVYSDSVSSVPISFSLGRRPSTEGPPLEYRNYSMEGGSPLGTIINWQFDGASLNFGLEDVTGIPGAAFKLCYGVGFEGDWGNSSSLSNSQPDVNDVHMFGFISTLYDNDATSLVLNYAHAWDITDGFTGLTVMPFIIAKQDRNGDGTPEYYFEPNSGGYISRMEPSTNIGDWDAASLLLRTNFSELFANIDAFVSFSWTQTRPSQISQNPFYEMMGQGLLSSNGALEDHNGYGIYAGVIFPMPYKAKMGLEYNWGSKYWFNFTGAEDSLVGSKLAARGQVFEGYYIQPIYSNNFFITLGGQYYDYEYTGSGNPMGKPVKISDATAFDSFNVIIDNVWVGYLSATIRF
ncbi:MAG: DUF3373 family protein [Desulfobacterales bacterium]